MAKRPAQKEMPLKGKGVEVTTDKKLIELSDNRINFSDDRNTAMKGLRDTDAEILNRMNILGLKSFRVGDKLFVNDAKHKVKVTNVKPDAIVGDADTQAITEKGA